MISRGSIVVRKDVPTALTAADGGYTVLQVDSLGRLRVNISPTDLIVTATAAANTAVTLTLPAPGVGLFHYITHINITRTATAVLAGTATLVVTTTNLPGPLAWSFGNAMDAGGTRSDYTQTFAHPVKSSVANVVTTIVAPAPGAAVLWRLTVFYITRA